MSLLTGKEIRRQIDLGRIVVDPFDPSMIGPNSIDVRLGAEILYVDNRKVSEPDYEWESWNLQKNGDFVLMPYHAVLGSTMERTSTDFYVPFFEGKSSLGRKFISSHCTAGAGDVGFSGEWTCEISSHLPARISNGMRIGQIIFLTLEGEIGILYGVHCGRYQNQKGPTRAREDGQEVFRSPV